MVNFGQLGKALDAAKTLAGQHSDKITGAIDKSVEAVDKATGGKHSEKIAEGAAKLKDATGKLSDQGAARSAGSAGETVRERDPATGAPPTPARDAPVSDPGYQNPSAAADAPVVDPDAPKDAP